MPYRRRKPTTNPESSDTSFLAGWMYADLFLALMVVFLATISFVPAYLSSANKVNSSYNYVKIYHEPLIVFYDSFDAKLLKNDIDYFLKTRGLPNTTDAIYAQVIGGYAKDTEDSTVAIQRALRFSQEIDASGIPALANVSTTLSSSSTLAPGRVALKLTFVTSSDVEQSVGTK
jgi:hypothetical protein